VGDAWRRAHDEDPAAVVHLEAGMVSLVGQRFDVICRPRAGALYQRNAHVPHLPGDTQSAIRAAARGNGIATRAKPESGPSRC
jgi:hypothetical protein